ncbi:G-type lectin S-receptor-like serine/threonine-protein kinase At4g03230 [Lycium ferocissimum]|uniref:G-type lectin S-receptor-like serine/threonine-protein kinase At4g03230 n=1 Tax=Lycium ferocissimum TaxID=112874 RepID=UPI002815F010|nr:G-type lectin S-receptor-like serine/threonine-protein kinase At4g03230 [Lycium ferocissimum]
MNENSDEVIDVPYFHLETILAATDNFSNANKLGQGGFGPVYKGIFPSKKEIAVKRLSSHSGRGIDEFKNEMEHFVNYWIGRNVMTSYWALHGVLLIFTMIHD